MAKKITVYENLDKNGDFLLCVVLLYFLFIVIPSAYFGAQKA